MTTTKTEGSAALKVIEQHESQLTQETDRANKALAKLHERGAVKDQEHADWIGRALVKAKENARGWKNIREEATRPLYQLWKSQVAKFQKPEDAYKQFISEASKLLGTWNAELKERARKREEEIRKAQEKEAEEKRKQLEAEAAEAKKRGDLELEAEKKAQAENPPITPVVIVPQTKPKYDGLVERGEWKAVVVDKQEFIAALLLGEIDEMYAKIEPNMKMLNELARNKQGRAKVPGIRFEEKSTFAAKS